MVMLEELGHARRRGAQIYAEVKGYGMSGDAHHITAPEDSGDGGYRAMKIALARASLTAANIDYVNAHGTSTPLGDEIELQAVERLFATPPVKFPCLPRIVDRTSSWAAGAVEAIFSILAIRDQIVPLRSISTIHRSRPNRSRAAQSEEAERFGRVVQFVRLWWNERIARFYGAS